MSRTTRFALWTGTVGFDTTLESRIAAAIATDCERVSISPVDVERASNEGRTTADIKRMFADAGLQLIMDPVMNWYGGTPRPTSRFGRFSADESLRMSEELGVAGITLLAQATDEVPRERIIESFGATCDRAATFGADVHLEFVPFTVVRSLQDAWEITSAADRTNGGICFDTYHFFRSDPDYELLNTIPGDRIMTVQIDDAQAEPIGTLLEDTQSRLLPGDGDFDLVAALQALDAIGGLSWIGAEVLSPVLHAMEPVDSQTLATVKLHEVMAAAGVQ